MGLLGLCTNHCIPEVDRSRPWEACPLESHLQASGMPFIGAEDIKRQVVTDTTDIVFILKQMKR